MSLNTRYSPRPAIIGNAFMALLISFAAGLIVWGINMFPIFILGAVGVVAGGYALRWLVRSPDRCLYALVITLPLEAAAVLEVGFTLRLSYLVTGLCMVSIWLAHKRKAISYSSAILPLALYVLISALSLIQVIIFPPPSLSKVLEGVAMRASGIRYFVQLFILILQVTLFVNLLMMIRDKAHLRNVIVVYIVVSLVIAAYALYQPLAILLDLPFQTINNAISTGGGGYGTMPYAYGAFVDVRSNSTFQEPGNLGQYLLSSLGLLIVYNPFRKRKSLLRFGAIALLFAGIAVTMSRGTFVSMPPMLLVLLATRVKKQAISGMIALGCAIVLFAAIVFPVIGVTSDKNLTFLSVITGRFGSDKMDKDERKGFANVLLSVWSEHPILGVGMGAYGYYGARKLDIPVMLSSHGVWQSTLVETGIVGFLSFLWFIWAIFAALLKGIARCVDDELRLLMGGLLAAITGVMFQYFFLGDRMTSFVWFLLALAVASSTLAANKNAEIVQQQEDV